LTLYPCCNFRLLVMKKFVVRFFKDLGPLFIRLSYVIK
jgi:hypothetical protein